MNHFRLDCTYLILSINEPSEVKCDTRHLGWSTSRVDRGHKNRFLRVPLLTTDQHNYYCLILSEGMLIDDQTLESKAIKQKRWRVTSERPVPHRQLRCVSATQTLRCVSATQTLCCVSATHAAATSRQLENSNKMRRNKCHNKCPPRSYSNCAIQWIIQSAAIKNFN